MNKSFPLIFQLLVSRQATRTIRFANQFKVFALQADCEFSTLNTNNLINKMANNIPTEMKRIRVSQLGDPSVLKVEQAPVPLPTDGQVLVEMKSIGVNPYETYIRSGFRKDAVLPYTPGRDGAGIIAAIGQNVTNVKVGDRVFITGSETGAYAQYSVCRANHVYRLPDKLSFDQGAAVNVPYKTAYRSLFLKAHAKPGQTLFVHGASGGVGIACVQFGRALGMTVIGTAGTEEGLKLILQEGAHYAINHRVPGYEAEVLKITNGKGANVITEMLANSNWNIDMKVVAQKGIVVIIGSRGEVQIAPRELMAKEAVVVGVMGGDEPDDYETFSAISAGLENGTLRPVVGPIFSLEESPKAHVEVIEHKNGSAGKVIIRPW